MEGHEGIKAGLDRKSEEEEKAGKKMEVEE